MTNSRFSKLAIGLATVLVSLPAFVSPVKAETTQEQKQRFLSILYSVMEYQPNESYSDAYVSEGLGYCLRLHQGWSNEDIITDRAITIVKQNLQKEDAAVLTDLFASIDVAATEVFCPEFLVEGN